MLRRSLATAILVCAATPTLFASKLKTWTVQTQSAYADARFENTVVSSQGTIRLAHRMSPLAQAKLDAAQVWDVVEDRDGNLIIATGGAGKVFKLNRAGELRVLFENEAGPVFSLAAAPNGDIFAGTGPDGRIILLSAKGEVKTLCTTGESYVWSMVYQPESATLFAATGPKGRVLRVSLDGRVETFLQTKQEHILCLAAGDGGILYAGTDKQGLIYRIDAAGKGFVLYQAPQGEVRTLLVTPQAVYAGTSAPTKKRGVVSAVGLVTATTAALTREPTAAREKATVLAAAPTSPGSGENSVYRLAPDGSVREVFREKAQMLALAVANGKLLVGTGMDGKLFEVDETTREFAEIARPDVGQIMKLLRRADGSIALATGDAGRLFILSDGMAEQGTVVSDVFDAKLPSKWGAVSWRVDLPAGTAVTLATRGGNTAEPDATWSDWSAESGDPAKTSVTAPACRFAQFRFELKSEKGKHSPAVHSVSLRYATLNQAPEITALETPDLDAAPLKDPKKLKIKWTALDPNEDELTFDILIRKDGWNDWARIEESWGKSEYDWDTTTMPSGVYRVKVVASDRTDNADESALTGARESGPLPVAHEPPIVRVKVVAVEGNVATLEATASSPIVRLASASYSVNGKRWENVFPTDGLFDQKEKSFRFQVESVGAGANVVVLRVKDVAANVGTADAIFTAAKK